jgi:SAM-dependent methyltransferase
VRFQQLDASSGLPEQYDVITTFDVVHDSVDPLGLLRAIHRGLRPDGSYVCLDINCSDKLEENAGPLGAMFHGVSVFYCMTTSLAGGGAGPPQGSALCGGFRSKTRSTAYTKLSRNSSTVPARSGAVKSQ